MGSVAKEEVQSSYTFFNRKAELERLLRILDNAPLQITVLLGPKDTGKSLLLTHLRKLWNSDVGRSTLAPMVIIDMCLNDCSSPDAMAAFLKTELGGWQRRVWSILWPHTMGTRKLARSIKSFWESIEHVQSLVAIQGIINSFLTQHESVKPVIVIDHAHKLAKAIELGLFSDEEAKQFFSEYVAPTVGLTLPQDWETSVWPSIFEAAGGSPYLLKTVACNASLDDGECATNLLAQAQDLIDMEKVNLEIALDLGEEEGWTRAELAGIVKAIVQGGGAVTYKKVVAEVFRWQINRANEVVKRLVRNKVIHVRVLTRATKYRDMPAQHTEAGAYLMATSPAAYAAMKSGSYLLYC
ncbi:hypothetical protein SELMODRAFT_419458 [Selaginella moellendorffii]|uniref:Uncharacterized protein n=1 Tax=Selaginella moellendorffii TaxID=88036 RepID=D8S909_SELML|nr:hypothetical protein SELMODRAFT_419458 [Selaginella moellendorffii]